MDGSEHPAASQSKIACGMGGVDRAALGGSMDRYVQLLAGKEMTPKIRLLRASAKLRRQGEPSADYGLGRRGNIWQQLHGRAFVRP
jgi:hypothetical protein